LPYFAADIIKAASDNGLTYTVLDGDKVVAIGGLVPMWSGVSEAWAIVMPGALRCFKAVHRAAHNLFAAYLGNGGRRIQTMVLCDFEGGLSWLKHLGFHHEGTMPQYGPDGRDYDRFARIKETK
jgi:hypothetical protein